MFVKVQTDKKNKMRRIRVPDEVLEAVGWSDLQGTKEVVAEVRGPGHLRLHRKDSIADQRAAIVATLEEQAAEDAAALEQLAVHHSRYIEIAYYPEEQRLRLPTDAVLVLASGGENIDRCYVQPVKGAVDLLSFETFCARQVAQEAIVGIELSM